MIEFGVSASAARASQLAQAIMQKKVELDPATQKALDAAYAAILEV